MKAYTKGAKRRLKKQSLPELPEIPKRQPNGQHRDRADNPRDPKKTALDARCRIFGGPTTREGRKAVSGAHMTSQIGMVLEVMFDRKEVDRIWSAFTSYMKAEWNYRRRYVGNSEFPKTAAIQMMRERFEVEESLAFDDRTEEEKDRAAVNRWMHWQGILGHFGVQERADIQLAKYETISLWDSQEPTEAGDRVAITLQRLADVSAEKS